MKILIKKATILDPSSKHHQLEKDILIENGLILSIKDSIIDAEAETIESENLHISQGWTDLNARFGEPGHEYKEDLDSGMNAAAQGGFTHIALMPSTEPCIQSKSDISYLLHQSSHNIVDLHPIGALTENRKGEQITEMYDMHQNGAIAFSDDKRSISNASLMKIALLYAQNFDGLIMSYSAEAKTAENGQMNEGVTSTKLGLKGIPALAEELQLARDLQLCEYTDAKIHFSTISTAQSVNLIREAKAKGLNVTADTSSYHLLLNDTLLESFNSNLKVNPPLRSEADIEALKKGLIDGTIDAICSDHYPQNIENKKCEFNIADFGMINLETSFAVANTALKTLADTALIVEKLTCKPRAILGLDSPAIEEGNLADLTLFDPKLKWTFLEKYISSKSKNTPLLGRVFTGKAIAIVNNGQLSICN
ncbi:MAG: dihydroorotase [Flavobacteriales bacterium]|jgi:dihydroorotase|tara:strand:+ start:42 stop:1310 length:1269 start_codon:yes stop_codon:yes gene_type:complete